MRLVVVVLLAACAAQERPPTIAHRSRGESPAKTCTPGDAVRGTVRLPGKQVAAGATVVASRKRGVDKELPITITDERGRFELAAAQELDRLTIYYDDMTYEGTLPRACEPVVIAIGDAKGAPGDIVPFVLVAPRR